MKRIRFLLLFISSQVLGQWAPVGNNGISGTQRNGAPMVWSMAVYDSTLYVGGYYDTAGNMPAHNFATWNGASWGSAGFNVNGITLAMMQYNGNLIVGGDFDTINGTPFTHIAQWNGSSWSGFANGIVNGGWVQALAVYNGNLYAAGVFSSVVGNNVSMWNGTSWQPVSRGVFNKGILHSTRTSGGAVYTMAVYNGKLYVGGQFDSAGTVAARNIAAWDGSNWSAVGTSPNDSSVDALAVYGNELYAGGYFGSYYTSVGTLDRWDGSAWWPVGGRYTGLTHNGSKIFSLYVSGTILCVGGAFDSIGTIQTRGIAYWDGYNWGTFGSGLGGFAFTVIGYNSKLYAGGQFSFAGSVPANNIAYWTGPQGFDELNQNDNKVKLYPSPNNGIFNLAITNCAKQSLSHVEIYNMLGEKVYSQTSGIEHSTFNINLSSQPSGVYLYRVLGTDGTLISEGKLVIEK